MAPDKRITSRKNQVVKDAAAVAASASVRREKSLFFCEGARLCEDAALSGIEITVAFATEQAMDKYKGYIEKLAEKAADFYILEAHVAEMLSKTRNTQGVFCVCKIPGKKTPSYNGKSAVLENTQDPANVGTIMRTAEALGIKELILTGETCDIYSPKVIRASMGAVFRLPVFEIANTDKVFECFKEKGTVTYASLPADTANKAGSFIFPENAALFIGNEGMGLSDKAIENCDKKITIPMLGRAESLNAAAAAAILMWEMMQS